MDDNLALAQAQMAGVQQAAAGETREQPIMAALDLLGRRGAELIVALWPLMAWSEAWAQDLRA